MELWRYWGFAPWSWLGMCGVTRLVTFLKPALLGDVAKYYAMDTVVWHENSPEDRERLWEAVAPKEDVMTQRFLFLEKRATPLCRIRSFWFGLRGYLEFHSYWPGAGCDSRVKDIAPLVDRAIELGDCRDV